MSKMKQIDAVIKAVKYVLTPDRLSNKNEPVVVKDLLNKKDRDLICAYVYNAIVDGEVSFNKPLNNPKKLRQYVRGMVSNHLRRSPKLLNFKA